MNLTDRIKKMPLGIKIACSAAVVAVIAAIVVAIVLSRNGYIANTMRLLRVEGTVTIEDSKGGTKPVIDNIRFQSGDALSTGSDGIASVGLDDTKIITLQNDSRAEFTKQGKHLELRLTKGAVFFNVTEKLQPDETFEIKTSTMTAGIRGTSGIVYYDEESNRDALIVTDGAVIVTATNPETGETRYAEVRGGQRIKVYLYSDRPENTVDFDLDDVTEEELSDFTLEMLVEDDELLNRVCDYTGWDKDKLVSFVDDINSGKVTGQVITLTPTPEVTETPDQTTSPTPSVTVTPTASPSPSVSPTVTPTPKPAGGANATSTPTPTVTPVPTVTNKPTATAMPTATATPSPTATVSPSPTATPTDEPEPTPATYKGHVIKEDCAPTEVWGEEFEGKLRYVCYDESSDKYYGYAEGSDSWIEVGKSEGGRGYYYLNGQNGYYYLVDDEDEVEPEVKSGCSKTSYWGDEYEGKTIYICKDDDYNYYGYDNGDWVLLDTDSVVMADGVVFVIAGTYDEYFSYSWGPAFNDLEPDLPDGYYSYIWGEEYKGETIYICSQTYYVDGHEGTRFMGYADDDWIELDVYQYERENIIHYTRTDTLEDYYTQPA